MSTDRSESVKIFLITAAVLIAGFVGYLLYDDYKAGHTNTGITANGELRIVYPYTSGGFYFDYFITDEGVVEKAYDTLVGRSNGKQGAVFSPVAEGKADIYTVWLEMPDTYDYKAEVFHVTVDSSKKMTYATEEITPRKFREISNRDRPLLKEEVFSE